MNRTHHCAELTKAQRGATVTLVGWIDAVRDHGGVLFVDLRDREGRTQVVFDPQNPVFPKDLFHRFKPESVIEVTGQVVLRTPETVNSRLQTGEIEVMAHSLRIHNVAQILPFPLEDDQAERVGEDVRLTYRYLDLRRPRNLERLRRRHRVCRSVRGYLDTQGFIEVETPSLFKSTPEGAREFLVPSRMNPGAFYALTQSPQQYKQMLMIAGVERYYSLARCYRDEDLRADRQPEFTQIDLEMSFVGREDMYALIEGMLAAVWKGVLDVDIATPFPRIAYREAMNRYGVDRPDTRFGCELVDATEVFKGSDFKVFASAASAAGGVVKALNAKGLADVTQGELKSLEDVARGLGAKGLAFIKVEGGEWKSPILKFLSPGEKAALGERLNVEEGDLVLFAAASWEQACAILGRIRLESAALLKQRGKNVVDDDCYDFLWVTEFPLVVWDAAEGRFTTAHHPFTSPVPEDIELLDTDPSAVRGQHYDVVLNGIELGGGSIRIHQPGLQRKVFERVLKLSPKTVDERFGYMLEALGYGAPPHGGIALGLDRLCAILSGVSSIREVMAFPKTQKGQDLMSGAPSTVTPEQLRDVFIRTASDLNYPNPKIGEGSQSGVLL